MSNKKYVLYVIIALGIILFVIFCMQIAEILFGGNIAMLYPKGIIALKQRNLLFIAQALMLIVVLPVIFLTFYFLWKYRADNTKAAYSPHWAKSHVAELIWWGVPCAIILALSIIAWAKTRELDPFRPISSDTKPLKIQVIALQWKWLFLYPEEKIATVNFLPIPAKTPLFFEITADAPMNSFWIPQLGGQIYAMPKMRTQLHLIADEEGNYRGSSANLSGKGFSGMHFIASALSEDKFNEWVQMAKKTPNSLTLEAYNQLAEPSANTPAATFLLSEEDLFNHVLMKYMMPQ